VGDPQITQMEDPHLRIACRWPLSHDPSITLWVIIPVPKGRTFLVIDGSRRPDSHK